MPRTQLAAIFRSPASLGLVARLLAPSYPHSNTANGEGFSFLVISAPGSHDLNDFRYRTKPS